MLFAHYVEYDNDGTLTSRTFYTLDEMEQYFPHSCEGLLNHVGKTYPLSDNGDFCKVEEIIKEENLTEAMKRAGYFAVDNSETSVK